MNILSFEEILPNLDLGKVEEAILQTPLLAHYFEDVKLMVFAAANKWLVSDLNMLSANSLGLEEEFLLTLQSYPVKGFIDLRGEYKHGENRGKVVVVDWKTSSGELDLTWQGRLVDSKQWKLYSLVPPGADFISYRGVNTKGKTREVYLKVPSGVREDVENYFTSTGDMMKALSGRDIWTQNMPMACGQFGQTCWAKNWCENGTAPRYLVPIEEITLSYSGAARFLSCPEKYRLTKRSEAGADSTDSTRIGNCFHLGIEEIYSQAFAKYGSS